MMGLGYTLIAYSHAKHPGSLCNVSSFSTALLLIALILAYYQIYSQCESQFVL